MTTREKLALLEELFEMEEGELNEGMVLSKLGCWDSMTAISLIVLMDEEFSKELTGEQIKAFKTVQDILSYMD